MRRDIRTLDITDTLRAGTSAVATAIDTVNAGSSRSILVTCSEQRMAAPAGDFEMALGDGAAALLIGDKNVIATIEGSYHISDEFSGIWRSDQDEFIRAWEDRMIYDKGYSLILPEAIKGLMKKYDASAGDFAKVVYNTTLEARRHGQVAKSLKFEPEQVQDPLFTTVGNTGSAQSLMILVAAP